MKLRRSKQYKIIFFLPNCQTENILFVSMWNKNCNDKVYNILMRFKSMLWLPFIRCTPFFFSG